MEDFTGWITPDGTRVKCSQWEHTEIGAKHPLLRAFLPHIEAWEGSAEKVRAACQEVAELEGSIHAEWHNYDMACQDLCGKIWRALVEVGCVRVVSRPGVLFVNGKTTAIMKHYQKFKDM